MKINKIEQKEVFDKFFDPLNLILEYLNKFQDANSKGIDRINGHQFAKIAVHELTSASIKIKNGTYKFTPYLELLKIKGRGKSPRIVSIPTIRDRLILRKINIFLQEIFPESIPKSIASAYVRDLKSYLETLDKSDKWVLSTDIKTFYDSIKRDRLIKILKKRIISDEILELINEATSNITVPKNTSRKNYNRYKNTTGIPQGLSISNILASIYMQDIDKKLSSLNIKYYRYVDDVIIIGNKSDVENAYKKLKSKLAYKGLSIHTLKSEKCSLNPINQEFSYLGYIFKENSLTVRNSSRENFLQSISSRISDYKHNSAKRLKKYSYLNKKILKEIFIDEINDKITGAFYQGKRYGWIGYYNLITEQNILYEMDSAIKSIIKRLPDFKEEDLLKIKLLSRSFNEIKYKPQGGYIQNFDSYETNSQKIAFLTKRGRLDPNESLDAERINEIFNRYVKKEVSSMLADEGSSY